MAYWGSLCFQSAEREKKPEELRKIASPGTAKGGRIKGEESGRRQCCVSKEAKYTKNRIQEYLNRKLAGRMLFSAYNYFVIIFNFLWWGQSPWKEELLVTQNRWPWVWVHVECQGQQVHTFVGDKGTKEESQQESSGWQVPILWARVPKVSALSSTDIWWLKDPRDMARPRDLDEGMYGLRIKKCEGEAIIVICSVCYHLWFRKKCLPRAHVFEWAMVPGWLCCLGRLHNL